MKFSEFYHPITEMEPRFWIFFLIIHLLYFYIYWFGTIIQSGLYHKYTRRYTACNQANAHIKTFRNAQIHANDRPKKGDWQPMAVTSVSTVQIHSTPKCWVHNFFLNCWNIIH